MTTIYSRPHDLREHAATLAKRWALLRERDNVRHLVYSHPQSGALAAAVALELVPHGTAEGFVASLTDLTTGGPQ